MRKLFTALEAENLEVALTQPGPEIIPPAPIVGDLASQLLFVDDEDDGGLYANMERNFTAAKSVGDTADVLLNAASGAGVQQPIGDALMVAIESLLSTVGEKAPKLEFHPQSSSVARVKNLQMACEGLVDTLVTIWKKLVEMIKRFVAWVAAVIKRKQSAAVSLEKKAKAAEVKIKDARKEEGPGPLKIDWKFFHSHEIASRLRDGRGVVPQGVELMRASLRHYASMRAAYEKTHEQLVVVTRNLLAAEEHLSDEGGDFNMHISSALADLQTEVFTTQEHTHTNAQKGLKYYEEALVFGARSYYRTTSNSFTEFNLSDLQAKVGPSTGAVDSYPEQKLYVLGGKYPEELLAGVRSHVSLMMKYLDSYETLNDAVDGLIKRLEKRIDSKKAPADEEREVKRARLMLKATSLYFMVFKSITGDINSYDGQVCDALLSYAVKSVD